jgi:hypothetical protein
MKVDVVKFFMGFSKNCFEIVVIFCSVLLGYFIGMGNLQKNLFYFIIFLLVASVFLKSFLDYKLSKFN